MFDSISGKYDFLNHLLSFGLDKYWRRQLIKFIKKQKHDRILDVATGTGDLAIAASKLKPDEIIGVDISEKMLELAKEKAKKAGMDKTISFLKGDAEKLPFDSEYFDVVMVAFGIRNFENLKNGLKEIYRILKPGGIIVVLEFSKPVNFPVKQLYSCYSKWILPIIGRRISGDKRAYTYLTESVQAFPDGDNLVRIFNESGYQNLRFKSLTWRVVGLYSGVKL